MNNNQISSNTSPSENLMPSPPPLENLSVKTEIEMRIEKIRINVLEANLDIYRVVEYKNGDMKLNLVGTGDLYEIGYNVGISTSNTVFQNLYGNYILMKGGAEEIIAKFSYNEPSQLFSNESESLFQLGRLIIKTGEIKIASPMKFENITENNDIENIEDDTGEASI